ncbi:phosphatidylglycerophosphate synthase [Rhizobium petrolearium]|uniref:CDP-alcohol phosphatidyltransferase family protein n=1 Tax=Neorhizobium petrolearium TaxID=515361 RepID=UPI001AE91625|nr:CDP-alcohol phosphatidyltransferase family protein [Neorhizobium petrolearium]MBP1847114.1 phosphatidylglycerophosphate synthase [Neorhizobium petrolearium]
MVEWMNPGHPDEMAARRAFRMLSLDAFAVMVSVAAVLVVAMDRFGDRLGMDTIAIGTAFVIYAAICAIALGNLHAHRHGRFGAANMTTTVRAAITAVVGGVVLVSDQFGEASRAEALWLIGSIVAFALALDGVDGHLARRTRTASRFGARFDMEVDALLILFLSIAAFLLGKAGIWVLLIGLMRYAYGAAQSIIPRLQGELPPSVRRKLICVVQGAALCLMLFPFVMPPVSTMLAAGALATLAYSFAWDVIFLLRASRGEHAS